MALFVLITLDMITTMYAARYVGATAEANPLIRIALSRGIFVYASINLVAALVAIGGFYALIRQFRSTTPPDDRYVKYAIELWLGLLIGAGLFVLANNLTVVLQGRSLIGFG